MDNDLDHGKDLNFSKGHRVPLKLFVLKGKNFDYYNKAWRGLGYVTPDTLIEPMRSTATNPSESSDWISTILLVMSFGSSQPT